MGLYQPYPAYVLSVASECIYVKCGIFTCLLSSTCHVWLYYVDVHVYRLTDAVC